MVYSHKVFSLVTASSSLLHCPTFSLRE